MADKKIGVIHYNWPGCDLEAFARRASEIGYTHCEIRAGDIWLDDAVDGAQRAEEVRALLERYGMAISAVEIGNDFLQADPLNRQMQIERYRQRCSVIPLTGTDIVRSDGGWNRNDQVPEDQWDAMMLEAFEASYRQTFSRTPPDVVAEIINIRVSLRADVPGERAEFATGPAGETGGAQTGSRPVRFPENDDFVETAVFDRARLRPGDTFTGPAVVEEAESTLIIGPGAAARVDDAGNLIVELPS